MAGLVPRLLADTFQKIQLGLNTETYTYLPLKQGEIRLLELLPCRDPSDPISCRLHNAWIDRPPPYHALSYAWGASAWRLTPRPRIFIDGKSLPVMPNLEAFLLQHRQDGAGPLLWIDAICINQDDIVERLQQIGIMCKLYTRCNKLIVWLGVGDDSSKTAIELLKLAARLKKAGPSVLRSWQNSLVSKYFISGENHHIPLGEFFSRSWFSRAWVVQEYALGCRSGLIIKCGSLQLSKEELEAVLNLNATDWTSTNPARDPKTIPLSPQYLVDTGMWYMNVVQLILNQAHISRVAQYRQTTNLLFWLTTLRYTNATDPRDKVYAALGLAESFNQNANSRIYDSESLIVDYRRPIGEVYASLVKSLVVSTKRLDVLLACCSRRHVTQTWTPDWTMPTNPPGFRSLLCGSSDNVLSKKGFGSSGNTDAVASFSSDLSTMTVRGIIWDTVDIISPCIGRDTEAAKEAIEFIKPHWDAIVRNKTYSSERSVLKRLWQTFLISADAEADELLSESDLVALGLESLLPIPFTSAAKMNLTTAPLLLSSVNTRIPSSTWWYRLFLTQRNRNIGKDLSRELKTGDLICIFFGCHVPVALRKVGETYEFVRSLYVDGLMFGEAIDGFRRGEVGVQDFVLT